MNESIGGNEHIYFDGWATTSMNLNFLGSRQYQFKKANASLEILGRGLTYIIEKIERLELK